MQAPSRPPDARRFLTSEANDPAREPGSPHHRPAAALGALDALSAEPSLRGYHSLPSARAHMFEKLGRLDEARAEFERAASLTDNMRQRGRLLDRARACVRGDSTKP